MAQTDGVIQAAGGVLWRPAQTGVGVEVALVHRPKYDDWSVPKGKLQRGENVVIGGLREVHEETGFHAMPGRPLGKIEYLKDGAPKVVRYWAMRQGDGEFIPNDEVDQIMWLPPREAQAHLAEDRDVPVMQRFAEDLRPTRPVLLVRHATAGDRDAWKGDDHDRPLDEIGRDQAEAIADLLDAYEVTRVLSADVLRCLETVGPFATRRRKTVQSEPLLSESGFAAHPDATIDRLLDIVRDSEITAVCTQAALLPDALVSVVKRLGGKYDGPTSVRKGAIVAVHLTTDGTDDVRAVELLPSPRRAARRD